MGMTLKELLTKGEGTLSAQEAKDLAAQCRMDVETLYTLLEERGIKILDNEVEADTSLDVDSIIAEVENAENNSDDMGIGEEEEERRSGEIEEGETEHRCVVDIRVGGGGADDLPPRRAGAALEDRRELHLLDPKLGRGLRVFVDAETNRADFV